MRRSVFALLLAACAVAAARPAAAQIPTLRPDTIMPVDTIPQEFPTPRDAFVRGLLVPGWGHAYLGEHRRAAIYATIQTTSWFMLIKTMIKLGDVQERDESLTALARDSLDAAMAADTVLAKQLADPERYESALLTYPGLEHARNLRGSREQQRQDWIVYTAFFTFLAAVDAYVTAHLQEFPAELTTSRSADGGVSVGMRVPVRFLR